MKHILISITLALLMMSCSAFLSSEGKVTDGPYTGYFDDGTLKQTGLIKRGEMQGSWKFYYPDGNLYAEGFYRNGALDTRDTLVLPEQGRIGKWTFYYAGGSIKKVGSYEDELMMGLWHFYTEGGVLDGKGKYHGGDGSQLGASGVPMHGRDGDWSFYYPNGKLRSFYEFLEGELHGISLSYFESGNLRSESFYEHGAQDSSSYGLHDSGNLWYRVNYEDGDRIGSQEEWYDNGQASSTWTFVDGQPQGKQFGWFENGQMMYVRAFDQGKEKGVYQAWHMNGNLEFEKTLIDGVVNGISKAWYENGQLKYTVDYIDGEIQKDITFWDEAGNISTEALVKVETSHGTFVVDVYEDDTPLHAENFKQLAADSALNGIYFHRIITDFVVQGGDPLTRDNEDRSDDGTGGIGVEIKAEIGLPHLRGTLGAARDNNPEKLSSGSQFYICLKDLPQLDDNYTVFGEVVLGMEVIDRMATFETDDANNPIEPITIISTEVASSF